MGLKRRLLHAITPYGLLGGPASNKGRSQVWTVEPEDADDPFLDDLEQMHSHAAQMALSKVAAADTLAAYRWYIEALTLATILQKATGDKLWLAAARSYRDLAKEQERILTRPATKQVLVTAPSPVAAPTPAAPVVPEQPVDEERDFIIRGLMAKPHNFPREMAENIADKSLAAKRGKA